MRNIIAFPFYVIGVTCFIIAAGLVIIGYLNFKTAQEIGD